MRSSNDGSPEADSNEMFDVTDDEFNVRPPEFQHVTVLISASSVIPYIHSTEQTFVYDPTSSDVWKTRLSPTRTADFVGNYSNVMRSSSDIAMLPISYQSCRKIQTGTTPELEWEWL